MGHEASGFRSNGPMSESHLSAEEVLGLLAEHDDGGEQIPIIVRLPVDGIEPEAHVLVRLARRIELVINARLAYGEPGPQALAGSFVALLLGRDERVFARTGRRLLERLVERGVIRPGGQLPPGEHGFEGARLYLPGVPVP